MTRVLYVEHNDDNLYMLKTRLELLGDFQVIAAEDIEKGRNLTVTEHPDVILMDLEMPNADCWEEVSRLKNDAQTGHIPIIGMSAYAVPSEREKAIATGCDEFEAKPIEFEFLVAPFGASLRTEIIPHCAGQDGAQPGRRTVNTEPLPCSLVTVTSPPIMRASLLVMARPSPVPKR